GLRGDWMLTAQRFRRHRPRLTTLLQGNGAAALLFHVDRHRRAVPEQIRFGACNHTALLASWFLWLLCGSRILPPLCRSMCASESRPPIPPSVSFRRAFILARPSLFVARGT